MLWVLVVYQLASLVPLVTTVLQAVSYLLCVQVVTTVSLELLVQLGIALVAGCVRLALRFICPRQQDIIPQATTTPCPPYVLQASSACATWVVVLVVLEARSRMCWGLATRQCATHALQVIIVRQVLPIPQYALLATTVLFRAPPPLDVLMVIIVQWVAPALCLVQLATTVQLAHRLCP